MPLPPAIVDQEALEDVIFFRRLVKGLIVLLIVCVIAPNVASVMGHNSRMKEIEENTAYQIRMDTLAANNARSLDNFFRCVVDQDREEEEEEEARGVCMTNTSSHHHLYPYMSCWSKCPPGQSAYIMNFLLAWGRHSPHARVLLGI